MTCSDDVITSLKLKVVANTRSINHRFTRQLFIGYQLWGRPWEYSDEWKRMKDLLSPGFIAFKGETHINQQ